MILLMEKAIKSRALSCSLSVQGEYKDTVREWIKIIQTTTPLNILTLLLIHCMTPHLTSVRQKCKWCRKSQRRLERLLSSPSLTLEENNYRNTVYLSSNSFSPGPHSWPYLHPALTQYAYPMSALRPGFWLAWISTLVSRVGVAAAV